MQRYDSYKDSGIQWLGQIPGHWEVFRFGALFNLKPFKEHRDNDEMLSVFLDRGIIRACESEKRTHNPSEDLSKYQLVEPSDFVMNNQQAWRGSVGVSALRGIISPAYHIFTLPNNLNPEYANIMLRDKNMVSQYEIASRGVGSIQRTLNFNWLNASKVLIPPIEEQKSIVTYLDRETEKINSFISSKEKEIRLLDELKQAEIANAVTHGLNPNVTMKDSGIAWLGQVPEHWEIKSLRSFIRLFTEKGYGDAQLLSVTREQGVIVRNKDDKEENHNFVPEDLSGYKHILPGDFVINKMKSWQGSYGVSAYDGIVSPAYFTCKLANVEKDYFSLAIRSKAYIPFFTQYSKGIRVGQWDLDPIALMKIPFILPPIDEQKEIIEYINRKCANIDKMISNIEQEITQLKEYKQRLIADAVTGQIKVC